MWSRLCQIFVVGDIYQWTYIFIKIFDRLIQRHHIVSFMYNRTFPEHIEKVEQTWFKFKRPILRYYHAVLMSLLILYRHYFLTGSTLISRCLIHRDILKEYINQVILNAIERLLTNHQDRLLFFQLYFDVNFLDFLRQFNESSSQITITNCGHNLEK